MLGARREEGLYSSMACSVEKGDADVVWEVGEVVVVEERLGGGGGHSL